MRAILALFLFSLPLCAQELRVNVLSGLQVAKFASPPAHSASCATNAVNCSYLFTDASATGVCSGGGSAYAVCVDNGTTFVAVAGVSTGLGDPGANSVPYRNASGATIPGTANLIQSANSCTSSGSANVYACSLSPAIAAYAQGVVYWVKADSTNTGSATIQLNAIAGPLTIVKMAGAITTTLAGNDIRSGQWFGFVYDGTNAQMVSQPGAVPGGAVVYTSAHTIVSSDVGKLVIMNCASACALTFESAPAAQDWWGVISIGATPATVSLNGKNFNGSANIPALLSYRLMIVESDGSNYFGDAPLVAGSNITLTSATNGLTVAATLGGGGNASINLTTLSGNGGQCTAGTTGCSGTATFTRLSNIMEFKTTLTGNVTSSSLASAMANDILYFQLCQDATGGRSFVWPTGFANAAAISPTASVCSMQLFQWDGSNANPIAPATSTDTSFLIIDAPERGTPATPSSGLATFWFDSAAHTALSIENGSTNQHKMPRCAAATDQCASTDLSDAGVAAGTVAKTIATGQTAMPTSSVSGNSCGAATTATATGTLTTDVVTASYASDPTGITGYGGGTSGGITIRAYPTANTVNFKLCNESGSSITPGALNINWRVAR